MGRHVASVLATLALLAALPGGARALPSFGFGNGTSTAAATGLQPQLSASVYLQVLAGSLDSQADAGLDWAAALRHSQVEQGHTCRLFPSTTGACVAVLAGAQEIKSKLLRGAAAAAQAAAARLNQHLLHLLGAWNKLEGAEGGGTVNAVCGVLAQVADAVVGSSGGSLAGDVIGTSMLQKLDAFGTGAAANSKQWPLPDGVAPPQLVKPCSPLAQGRGAEPSVREVSPGPVAAPAAPARARRFLRAGPH
ncbi:MAG: hypothetical protein J3K34DRAFT_442683 [Monoraphidium minutum]|nr:MAG: hypothetical protein J3K34DRAFT_442683 [Monoraphidium minutum]